jgi:DNA-binding LytR/AlgR family response regulator
MPELGGFDTAEHLKKIDRKAGIIFATNNGDQVYNSFRYSPKKFLVKPIYQHKIDVLMDELMHDFNYHEEDEFYMINLKSGGAISLHLPEVLYFQSENNYVLVTTIDDEYTCRSSMEKMADELKERGFIRVSRKVIVNRLYVFQVFADYITLKTGEHFSIGRTYKTNKIKDIFKGLW